VILDLDEYDGPELCERCREPALVRPPTPTGGRDPRASLVCGACRREGWRGARCDCGELLHKRDYASNGRDLVRPTACGKCRANRRREAA
jgi:hypothetical protein